MSSSQAANCKEESDKEPEMAERKISERIFQRPTAPPYESVFGQTSNVFGKGFGKWNNEKEKENGKSNLKSKY